MGKTTLTGGLDAGQESLLQMDFRLRRTCQYCGLAPKRTPLLAMGNGNRRHAECRPPVTPQVRA